MELYSYLDYCHKYHVSPADKLSFSTFHKKLSSKNQSEALCRQAHAAVVLYHEMLRANHKLVSPQTSDQTQDKESAIDRNQIPIPYRAKPLSRPKARWISEAVMRHVSHV